MSRTVPYYNAPPRGISGFYEAKPRVIAWFWVKNVRSMNSPEGMWIRFYDTVQFFCISRACGTWRGRADEMEWLGRSGGWSARGSTRVKDGWQCEQQAKCLSERSENPLKKGGISDKIQGSVKNKALYNQLTASLLSDAPVPSLYKDSE